MRKSGTFMKTEMIVNIKMFNVPCCLEMLYSNIDPEAVVRNKENGFVYVSSIFINVMDVS